MERMTQDERYEDYNDQLENMQQESMQPQNQASNFSRFGKSEDNNLVQWQLEINSILEILEHSLKGDKPTFQDGDMVWKEAHENDRILNDKGVDNLMAIAYANVNRNTILSNYKESDINLIVYDLGLAINDNILCNYEKYGMTTTEKRSKYRSIVLMFVNMVRSAYLRALNGGERESLITARQVIQNDNMGMNMGRNGMPIKERGLLNPLRYVIGK